MYCCGHLLPGVLIVVFVKYTLDWALGESTEITLNKIRVNFTPLQ